MMDKLLQLWRRLLFYLRRNRFDCELEEEMRFHLEMKAEETLAAGISPEEARYAARRQFGNQTLLREVSRDMWIFRYLETIAQDLRFCLRTMRKNPGFTAVAVLTLALGIGANTAMFSAADAVLIRPLPYSDAGRLVMIWDDTGQEGESKFFSSPAEWSEWRRHNTVFTDIAASQPENLTFSGDGEPEELPSRKVTANLWAVLGVKPLLGRVFTEEEDTRGERVAVISYALWQRRFGALPDVLGRKIMLSDRPY